MLALYESLERSWGETTIGRVLLLSSAQSGEGTTTLAESLALTLASRRGLSVLMIDAGPRHDLRERLGFGETNNLEEAVRAPEAGTRPEDMRVVVLSPDAVLSGLEHASPALAPLIDGRVRARFQYTIVDAPSLNSVPWVTALGHYADGTLLVVEAERTRWPVVLNARREFERAGSKLLGVFLNRRRMYIPQAVYRRL